MTTYTFISNATSDKLREFYYDLKQRYPTENIPINGNDGEPQSLLQTERLATVLARKLLKIATPEEKEHWDKGKRNQVVRRRMREWSRAATFPTPTAPTATAPTAQAPTATAPTAPTATAPGPTVDGANNPVIELHEIAATLVALASGGDGYQTGDADNNINVNINIDSTNDQQHQRPTNRIHQPTECTDQRPTTNRATEPGQSTAPTTKDGTDDPVGTGDNDGCQRHEETGRPSLLASGQQSAEEQLPDRCKHQRWYRYHQR